MNRARVEVLVVGVVGAACTMIAAAMGGCKGENRAGHPAAGDGTSGVSQPAAAAQPAGAPPTEASPTPAPPVDVSQFSTPADYDTKALNRLELTSGLVIEDLKIGTGQPALPGAIVTFHYRGKVAGGEEVNCTLTPKADPAAAASPSPAPPSPAPEVQPLSRLFDGLKSGMVGMQAGGRRRLTIPAALAPGVAGMKDQEGRVIVPGDATLIYVIDLVEIKQRVVTTPADAQAPAPAAPRTESHPPNPGRKSP
jgi:hypothetical protein